MGVGHVHRVPRLVRLGKRIPLKVLWCNTLTQLMKYFKRVNKCNLVCVRFRGPISVNNFKIYSYSFIHTSDLMNITNEVNNLKCH